MLRNLSLLLLIAVGWVLARWLHPGPLWNLSGGLAGATVWLWVDAQGQARLEAWLRKHAEGRPPGLWGVWADISERVYRAVRLQKRKTRSAHQRLDEFLSAIQASPNGVILLDQLGRMEWCNRSAAEHLGVNPVDDERQVVRNVVRDPAFAAYLQSEQYAREVQFLSPNDPSGQTHIAVQLFPYGKSRFLLLSRDVTLIRRAERMRRDFVANVSHEIKTPLTVIRGFVETLQELRLEEDQRQHYLDLMGTQAERLNSLVSDLLTLSTLEGSPPPPINEWHTCEALSKQVLSDAQALNEVLHAGGQTIAWAAGEVPQISGSWRELLSALGNLVSNAVRYTPDQGSIRLSCERGDDDSAEFVVEDNGAGIPAAHLSRLSERFYRVDQSRSRETGGTGLGLAIVKHIAQRHGGELLIRSEVGKGSRFSVRLPARRVRWPDGV